MTSPALFAPPKIDGRFVCVVDRENVELAAVISSHFARPGYYFPLFEFPGVKHPDRGQDKIEDDDFLTKIIGSEAAVKLGNILARIDASDYVILAGLSSAQKSYLSISEALKVVEIARLEDAPDILASIDPGDQPTLACKPYQVHHGLLHAFAAGADLRIDPFAADLDDLDVASEGLVVVESALHHSASIVALNYAHSIGASVKLVNEFPRADQRRVLELLQDWKDGGDEASRDALFMEIDSRIGSLDLSGYRFVTFFTDGLPYTLRTKESYLCTYVHLSNHADHFILNGILAEVDAQLHSGVVFTIDEFLNNGEAKMVSCELQESQFFVRPLAGIRATGFSFGYHAEHFPYGVFHIVSHGGEIGGYAVTEEFTDRNGTKHVLEYDEVVGIHRVLTEDDRFGVQRKLIFKAIDGIDWNSDDRTQAGIPHFVYEDMRKQIFSEGERGEGFKRIPKANVPLSCSVKCNDGVHQAMFRSVGGYGTPLIFNNTCWSWWGISDFFISGGARAYLGTFWSVEDTAAVTAAKTFYLKALGGNIASAVREASRAIEDTEDAGIYGLWGLHFSTLSKGQDLEKSTSALCDRLATLLRMYGRFLESGVTADDARDNAIEALELLDQDFDGLCEGPGVDRLRARMAETLSNAGPKKRSQKRYSH